MKRKVKNEIMKIVRYTLTVVAIFYLIVLVTAWI